MAAGARSVVRTSRRSSEPQVKGSKPFGPAICSETAYVIITFSAFRILALVSALTALVLVLTNARKVSLDPSGMRTPVMVHFIAPTLEGSNITAC